MSSAELRTATLGATGLAVSRLCLGSNIFGWTADRRATFAVLDAFRAAGGNFIDTADVYSVWVEGHTGGEAEELIGSWMRQRGCRDEMVIATKVGLMPGRSGLSAGNIEAALCDSLRRLQTDHVDLYYAHAEDADTPLEDTLEAFDRCVHAGKVRHIAASNHAIECLARALAVSGARGLAAYVAVSPPYNLLQRSEYEGPLADLCEREALACVPYFGLARGFLTGKYRAGSTADTRRTGIFSGAEHMNAHGHAVLAAVQEVASARDVSAGAVSLAWLLAQRGVTAAVASARTAAQLADILPATDLALTPDEVARLTSVATPTVGDE